MENHMKKANLTVKSNLEKKIVIPSLVIIVLIVVGCIAAPELTNRCLETVKAHIFASFSWVYILAVSFFLLLLCFLCIGKLGDIRLGDDDATPDYSFFSWICMLFAAGMGIGLMYFGVAEPVLHYASPLHASASPVSQMKEAMLNTLFHWGVHAWAVYGIVGLSLAYFSFRYRLPLTIRSAFYPLLKNGLNGFRGNLIDIIALCSTIFGLTTTLGYGALQLNAGLSAVGVFHEFSFSHIVLLIVIAISLAILSAISGIGKGIRILSQSNLLIAIALMLFLLFAGPTVHILSAFSENIGYYLSNIIELSFRTFAYESAQAPWFMNWTILYWAWWISWAPFVGLFIAEISRGRTIREFVLGVLLVPSLFNILWMTVFGNGAIWLDQAKGGILSAITDQTEGLLFAFLAQFPLFGLTAALALLTIFIFFVTSADSGIFVINSIASNGKHSFPKWQSILWGSLMALLAISLLYSGGLTALRTMTVIMALPFAIVLVIMALCLVKGLMVDNAYFTRGLSKGTAYWTGAHWKDRLSKIISTHNEKDFQKFMIDVVKPAFTELAEEFQQQKVKVRLNDRLEDPNPYLEIVVGNKELLDFVYGVTYIEHDVSSFLVNDPSVPTIKSDSTLEPVCYFADGRRGYSVKYMRKEELITDVLRQYERYIKLVSDVRHNLYLFENR